MIFRIYDVVDLISGKVIKIGSTYQTLEKRWASKDYQRNVKYEICRLVLAREFEWPDADKEFGIILARVREQIRIGQQHLWRDETKDNRSNYEQPVSTLMKGFDWSVISIAGGIASSQKKANTGQDIEIGKRIGSIYGPRNADSGLMSRIGKIYGHINGMKNVENGQLAKLRTPEHQSFAGRAAAHARWNHSGFLDKCQRCSGSSEQKAAAQREASKKYRENKRESFDTLE